MKILFTICGRAGSKGIKNKNIRNFLGKPLPYYTLSTIDLFLKNTNKNIESDIVVSTDSEELKEIMKCNNIREVEFINRSKELSGDFVSKIDVINDCMEKMENINNKNYDFIIDCDITSPLRTSDDIENLLSVQIETKADVTTSVAKARRNPFFNQLKKSTLGYELVNKTDYICRQQAPEVFDMNASLYIYKPEFLKKKMNVLDGHCEIIEMIDTGILDLDHESDFEIMEVVAKYLFDSKEAFKEIFDNIK